jgi:hypothetical protein
VKTNPQAIDHGVVLNHQLLEHSGGDYSGVPL